MAILWFSENFTLLHFANLNDFSGVYIPFASAQRGHMHVAALPVGNVLLYYLLTLIRLFFM